MKSALLIIVGSLLALVLVVFAIGAFLPLTHQVTRSTTIAAAPESVWAVVADLAHQPAWRPSLERVDRITSDSGREVWREVQPNGDMLSLETTVREPPNRLVRVIADHDAPFRGSWEIVLQPAAGGTLVQVTERGSVPNPLFRFVSRFVLGQDASIQQYLDDLAARFRGRPST